MFHPHITVWPTYFNGPLLYLYLSIPIISLLDTAMLIVPLLHRFTVTVTSARLRTLWPLSTSR